MVQKLMALVVLAAVTAFIACESPVGDNVSVPAPPGSWFARHNISGETFASLDLDLRSKGYQITYLNGHDYQGEARYNAIWRVLPPVLWLAFHDLTEAGYQNKVDELKAQGYQPVMVNPFQVNGQPTFTAFFQRREPSNGWYARHDMTAVEYQDEYDDRKAEGFRLVHVSGYVKNDEARYAAIWEDTTGPELRATHGVDSETYQSLVDDYLNDGFSPVLADVYSLSGQDYYSAIWHEDSPRWSARHGVALSDYQQLFDDHFYEGYYPRTVAGYGSPADVRMAAIFINTAWNSSQLSSLITMIEDYRVANSLSGLSIAITLDERLVYARGFGQRDPSRSAPMTTGTVSRIASNSKAITGAAAARLIDEGKLDPLATVFGPAGVLAGFHTLPECRNDDDECQTNLGWLLAIQVVDVLEHTMGGWSNSSALEGCSPLIHLGFGWNICDQDDPSLGAASRDDFVSYIVSSIPLLQAPNGSMIYSNVGYNIAEQLIEVASGQNYEQYIDQTFIRPSGSDCVLALPNNALYGNEVSYVTGAAYVMNHRRMAGHGGWVCSAVGYLRLMTRLDGGSKRPDLFSADAFTIFTTSDRGGDTYAKGIRVTGATNRHNGALRSVNSEYVYWNSDRMSIFLFADTQLDNYSFAGYNPLYDNIRNGAITFPDFDLF